MRKKRVITKVVAMLLSFAVVFSMIPGAVFADTINLRGTGTAEDPYLINNATDLVNFRKYVAVKENRTKCAKLTADIDLTGITWIPFATTSNDVADNYGGTFDGDGYEIRELSDTFFSTVNGATIKNLTINGNVNGNSAFVGGIIGKTQGIVNITNCAFKGSVVSTNASNNAGVGGIVGRVNYGNVLIEGCVNYANITGSCAGGILGYLSANGTKITDCYNAGTIKGSSRTGGLTGQVKGTDTKITNCYNRKQVEASKEKSVDLVVL